jgi:tetratricopeptide (TPR) repeat protein/DNA-binding SARP family transcriptional activator
VTLHLDCSELEGLEISFLGTATTRLPGRPEETWGTARTTQLFALLALNDGEPVARQQAEAELWDHSESANLAPVSSRLRTKLREVGLGSLVPPAKGQLKIGLPAKTVVDCLAVEEQVKSIQQGVREEEIDAAWETIRQALVRLGADFIAGSRRTDFIANLRRHYEELAYDARLEACELAIRSGNPDRLSEAMRYASAAIRQYPKIEEPYLALVRLRLEAGDFAKAFETCDACERACESDSQPLAKLRAEVGRRKSRRRKGRPPLILSVNEAGEQAPFVGREKILDELLETLALVETEQFVCMALTGDKGTGKSRLARQFARRANACGIAVLSAGAIERGAGGDDPCGPLIAAIEAWTEKVDSVAIEALSKPARAEVGRFVPNLVTGSQTPPPLEGAGQGERLRRSIVELFGNIAEICPTLLLIDDIREADQETLACVKDLCAAQPANLMVLVTASAEGTGDLRMPRHQVPPLEPGEATELAAAVIGDADLDKINDLVSRGAGNPFLIIHQTEPDRIETDFVLPQLGEAAERGREVLRLAALLGSSFELETIRQAAGGADADEVITAAERRGLIAAGGRAGTFVFCHSLTRDALLGGLGTIERGELSSRLAATLSDDERHAAIRLSLLKNIVPAARDSGAIVAAALEAGNHAIARRNYRSALRHYEDGLELADCADAEVQYRLLVGVAASHWSLGEFKDARIRFLQAVRLPEIAPNLRAEAALGFGGRLGFGDATIDRQYVSVLRSALDNLPDGHDDLRLRIQGALAGSLALAGRSAEERRQKEELVDIALAGVERTENVFLAAEVLSDVCWAAWQPRDDARRRHLARTFVEFADKGRDIGLWIEARIFRAASALEDGEMQVVREDIDECVALAEQAELPHYQALVSLLSGMSSLLGGDLDAAEKHSREALRQGGREQNPGVFELYGAQVLMIRLFEGRTDKIRASAEAMAGAFPEMPAWKAGLGLIYAELGRLEDAQRQLDLIARERFEDVVEDLFWLVTLDHAARLAARLRDRPRCEELYELLLPYAGKIVTAGAAVAVYGAVDRALGLLAAANGNRERAVEHLSEAQRINQRIGATAINVYVTAELADVLHETGSGEAEELADRARKLADDRGLHLQPRAGAQMFSQPSHPPGAIGSLKQGGADRFTQFLRRKIEGKSEQWMQQWVRGTRLMRRGMPLAFLPSAACGWTGEIEVEFQPPIGLRGGQRYWTFTIGTESARIEVMPSPEADVRLAMSPPTFFKLMAGELNPVEAWLSGAVSLDGDPTVAARLIEMFTGPTPDVDLEAA